jgi:hypothetical protein
MGKRMTLFLDTEFNGFNGPLISLALVGDDGDEFYGVRRPPRRPHPWVKANIIPNLNQAPQSDVLLRGLVAAFLHAHKGEPIIADWPLDFAHLLSFMCVDDRLFGPGSLLMRLVPQEPLLSEIPHNALSDARALMAAWANTTRLQSFLQTVS